MKTRKKHGGGIIKGGNNSKKIYIRNKSKAIKKGINKIKPGEKKWQKASKNEKIN